MACEICGDVGEVWSQRGIWPVLEQCPKGCEPKHRSEEQPEDEHNNDKSQAW